MGTARRPQAAGLPCECMRKDSEGHAITTRPAGGGRDYPAVHSIAGNIRVWIHCPNHARVSD